MAAAAWTPWRQLRLHRGLSGETLAEVLDGGQSFRWALTDEGAWAGVFGRCVARLRSAPGEAVEWSGPVGDASVEGQLLGYLDAAGDQERLADALPWRSDAVLRDAMARYGTSPPRVEMGKPNFTPGPW